MFVWKAFNAYKIQTVHMRWSCMMAAYNFYRDKPRKHISVSDLPWESREAVLRALFVKMNTEKRVQQPHKPTATPLADNIDSYAPMSQGQAQLIRCVVCEAISKIVFCDKYQFLYQIVPSLMHLEPA